MYIELICSYDCDGLIVEKGVNRYRSCRCNDRAMKQGWWSHEIFLVIPALHLMHNQFVFSILGLCVTRRSSVSEAITSKLCCAITLMRIRDNSRSSQSLYMISVFMYSNVFYTMCIRIVVRWVIYPSCII